MANLQVEINNFPEDGIMIIKIRDLDGSFSTLFRITPKHLSDITKHFQYNLPRLSLNMENSGVWSMFYNRVVDSYILDYSDRRNDTWVSLKLSLPNYNIIMNALQNYVTQSR